MMAEYEFTKEKDLEFETAINWIEENRDILNEFLREIPESVEKVEVLFNRAEIADKVIFKINDNFSTSWFGPNTEKGNRLKNAIVNDENIKNLGIQIEKDAVTITINKEFFMLPIFMEEKDGD